ncbi:MAG: hypothetical protein ACFFD2_01775 [Promethearchaeota archaeon]
MIVVSILTKVEEEFYFTLKKLSQNSVSYSDFSGIGLILYDPNIFNNNWYVDLRPSIQCPRNVRLGNMNRVLSTLLEIAKNSNPLHDGFHFFNYSTGLLTHIAQYFFPPIIPKLKINEYYGTRYHSALYGSCINGVILTGTINSNNKYFVFKKGHLVKESEFKENY